MLITIFLNHVSLFYCNIFLDIHILNISLKKIIVHFKWYYKYVSRVCHTEEKYAKYHFTTFFFSYCDCCISLQ